MNLWKTDYDDPRITDMDPVRKLWMYNNWLADKEDQAELAKNHAYLLGSFWNPEAVKQLMGIGNTFTSTDEELDETADMVRNFNLQALKTQSTNPIKRKKKKRIK